MESTERKILTEVPLINSLLKEAVFLGAACTITSNGHSTIAAIVEIIETDPRDRASQTRKIKFRQTFNEKPKAGSPISIEVPLSSFVIIFETEVHTSEDGFTVSSFPNEIVFFQRRKSGRTIFNGQLFSTVLLETESSTSESELLLLNTSSNGYGGVLRTRFSGGSLKDAKIYGKINLGTYFQEISAEIAHHSSVKILANGLQEYQVGLRNQAEQNSQRGKRSNVRLAPKNPNAITLSAEASGRTFEVDGIDFSISGFSGKLRNTDDFFFPLGTLFREANTTRIFKLIHGDTSQLRFFLQSSSIPDRTRWATMIIENGAIDSEFNKKDAKELIRLFTEAGAINQDVFQRTSKYWSLFDKNYRDGEIQSRWIFRCLSYRGGRLSGHVSGIRFSDTHWFIGDGAGGHTKSSKVEPTFIPRYFRAFREFALNLTPSPRILMIWKKGHSFWKNFENHLRVDRNTSIGQLHHSPLPVLNIRTEDANVSLTEISPSSFEQIRKIRTQLFENSTLSFAEAFDFDEFRFGSPAIRTLNEDLVGSTFERKYFELNADGYRALVIFTFLPHGLSVNQVITSAYVLRLDGRENGSLWERCKQRIQQVGIANGMEPSSIRRVTREDEPSMESESYSSTAFITDARSLEFYEQAQSEAG